MRVAPACTFMVVAGLAGCASAPPSSDVSSFNSPSFEYSKGRQAADTALKLIGTPYAFGGADPVNGFDCSGLVAWSFRQAGVVLPHNTEALRRSSRPVAASELRAGDLLFFDLESKKNSHVGIYAGDGHFVHAPSTGKDVRQDRLDSPYWRTRLSEARRPLI